MRLAIPVIELRFDRAVAPHQDGPERVNKIQVDVASSDLAIEEFRGLLDRMRPIILDQVALAGAFSIKNERLLRQLRDSWRTLRAEQRERVKATTQMSTAYIEGLLHNGRSLELATEFQRRQLELVLGVQRDLEVSPPRLNELQQRLLATAGEEAGLQGFALLVAVSQAELRLAGGRRRPELVDEQGARDLIREILTDVEDDER